jgi:hypothetical protein
MIHYGLYESATLRRETFASGLTLLVSGLTLLVGIAAYLCFHFISPAPKKWGAPFPASPGW